MKPEQYWIDRGEDVIGIDVMLDPTTARQAATYRAIAERLKDTESVFDIGCNIAVLSIYLRAAGFGGRYSGIDSNPHALAVARQHEPNVKLGNLRRLAHKSSSFQWAVVKDLIEHLEDPALISEAFRVTRDGVLISSYLPWSGEPMHIEQHPDGYYVNRYNWQDMQVVAKANGFELAETEHINESNGQPNLITVWRRI